MCLRVGVTTWVGNHDDLSYVAMKSFDVVLRSVVSANTLLSF